MNKTKSFDIPKQLIWRAYKQVSKNKGAAGVDEVSITKFEENLKDNLYKPWNRMSSGIRASKSCSNTERYGRRTKNFRCSFSIRQDRANGCFYVS